MRRPITFLLLFLLPSACFGEDVSISADMVHAIELDTQHIVLSSAKNVARVDVERGPIRVRAKFSDSDGKFETRIFASDYVVLVEPVKAGTAEILLIPLGIQSIDEMQRFWLTVTDGTNPKPPPGPEPEPKPRPEPTPVDLKVSLAVVEDTLKRTPETARVLNAIATWNEFADEGHDWRFYDIKTTERRGLDAISAARDTELPALVIRDKASGKVLRVMPLPENVDSLKRIVREVAGDGN